VQTLAETGMFVGFCTEYCVVGAPLACSMPTPGHDRRACLGDVTFAVTGNGPGDVNTCVGLCDGAADCSPNEHCEPSDLAAPYHAAGMCLAGAAMAESSAGSGGAGGEDSVGAGVAGSGAGGAPSACTADPVRACELDGCLGTTECQPDGSYGPCQCLESGDEPSATADAPGPSHAGAGCGCRLSGVARAARAERAGLGVLFLLGFVALASRRGSRHLMGNRRR
jgi:hypothetical protein